MKTNKKGISLIVLIITILVMIIIAAAIILYLDDSKVIRNAKKAVTSSNASVAKEVMVVAKAEWNSKKNELIEEGYYTFEKFAEYKLGEVGFEIGANAGQVDVSPKGLLYTYIEPIIPEGYIASDISTEDEISEGLVIYEGDETVSTDEDAMETRNQFVWVPVPNMSEFVRKDFGIGNSSLSISVTTSYDLDSAQEAAEYTAMKESVAKYGGFYIARYEGGNENDIPVSKKRATVWNSIDWSNAKAKCTSVSPDGVVGHLIYGEEWDAALNFISKTDADYATNSTGKGWYTSNYSSGNANHKTGIDVDTDKSNMKNNIYDMAGNVFEITTEAYSTDSRVIRGGYYNNEGIGLPSSYRDYVSSSSALGFIGFRIALYLK